VRLSMLDRGHFRLGHRLKMKMMGLISGHRAPDVVKLHFFRHETVGRRMSASFQAAMRGPSDWSVFERETMAARVSALNQCVF
jgi:hypothetical protein